MFFTLSSMLLSSPRETVCPFVCLVPERGFKTNNFNQDSVRHLILSHTLFISVLRHAATHIDVSPESSLGKQGASLKLF